MPKFASNGVANSRRFMLQREFLENALKRLSTQKSVIITLDERGLSESRLKYELGRKGLAYRKLEGASWLVSR